MNEYNTSGRTEDQPDSIRDRVPKGNVVIDSTSAGYLSEATLDWIDDPFKSTFHFKIPNTKSCGCGDSFQFEGE
jgi:Fe-S cluster assembly iron-binding protein IscA